MKQLQVFNFNGNNIRTVLINGEINFLLNDVCEALGLSAAVEKEYIGLKDLFFIMDGDFSVTEKRLIHKFIRRAMEVHAVQDEMLWFTHDLLHFLVVWEMGIERNNGNEANLQDWICDNVESFFGTGFEINKREYSINGLRADFLISNNKKSYIVECKVGKITQKSVQQIQNYLFLSGINRGILVGGSCEIDLPTNIRFIPHRNTYKGKDAI